MCNCYVVEQVIFSCQFGIWTMRFCVGDDQCVKLVRLNLLKSVRLIKGIKCYGRFSVGGLFI